MNTGPHSTSSLMHAFISRSLTFLALLGVLLVLATPLAFAQGTQAQLETYLEEAKDDYDMLMFDEATETLRSGIRLAEREGIRNRTVAELHVFLGIVLHAAEQTGEAEQSFIKAVETFPEVELDPLYRTPALEDLMTRARRQARPPEPEPEPVVEAEPELLEDLVHEPVRRGRGGEPILIEARVPENIPVFRVYLYYRHFGDEEFQRREMLPRDSVTFAATLESEDVHSTQIEYYISGESRAGESITEAGRRNFPFRIAILGDTQRAERPGQATGPGEPIDDPRPRRERDGDRATGFYGTLIFGTDFGFLPGTTAPTANSHRSVTPGLAPAFAHTAIDLGWRISELNNIGLYFRWQFSPPQDFGNLPPERFDANAPFWQHEQECFGMGLPGDCILGLRYQRIVSTGFPEIYSSVGLGVGRVRNWLRLKEATSPTNPNPICANRDIFTDPGVGDYCYIRDTVRTGWAHLGIGGGMYFPVHDMLDIVADSYLMILVPDTSVNLDLNIGLRFRL